MRVTATIRRLMYVLVSTWVLLAMTGVFLAMSYRPTAPATYADMETLSSAVSIHEVLRIAHRIFGVLALVASLGLLASVAIARQNRAVAASVVTTVASGAAVVVGFWLPWDQIALRAVTLGTNMRGFAPIFSNDQVRFVLINGTEVSLNTFRVWLVLHVIVLPLIMMASVMLTRTLSKRASVPQS